MNTPGAVHRFRVPQNRKLRRDVCRLRFEDQVLVCAGHTLPFYRAYSRCGFCPYIHQDSGGKQPYTSHNSHIMVFRNSQGNDLPWAGLKIY